MTLFADMRRITMMLSICLVLVMAGCIERKPDRLVRKESPVSAELLEMVTLEQAQLDDSTIGEAEADAVALKHQERVLDLLARALIEESADLYRSALILHRAEEANTCLLAYYLALQASKKGHAQSRFLAAAAYDRQLVLRHLPQRFGTQSFIDSAGDRVLYPIDSLIGDSERAAWDVPALESLKTTPYVEQ